ncbi:anti-sigma factor family protein [Neotabrizicola sp. sgz301269]|uniref:anti-sigma factor family protein n=1 Tax=Neotabrizicola sp. sgz301269 TaxID=3276282 RepID=UPI00376FA812
MSSTPLSDDEALCLRHGSRDERQRLLALADEDPSLAARLAEWNRQDAAISALYAPVADEPVPQRLRAALHTRPRPHLPLWRIAALLAVLGCGFAAGWGTARLTPPAAAPRLAAAALGSYATYASEVLHPVEVPASDEAHLVKWLSKRLGTAIRPPDLAAEGFRLIGGRLLPGDTSPAALLMYEDDLGRRLALYVTRSEGHETEMAFAEEPGAQAFWWIDGNLGCALVGDLPRDQLRRLAISAYHGLTEA